MGKDDLFDEIRDALDISAYIEEVKSVSKRCLAKTVLQTVYSRPESSVYKRIEPLYHLINSIDADFDGNDVFVFFEPSKLKYYSVLNRSLDVSLDVPIWLNYGHKGLYGVYPAQKFLEDAQELIEQELGISVIIEVR